MAHVLGRLSGALAPVSFRGSEATVAAPSPSATWAFVSRAVQVSRERSALRRLSDRELADIGLSRSDAAAEAARPVWDLPAARR